MNNNELFNTLVSFITSVHNRTFEWTSIAKPHSVTPLQYKILEYIFVSEMSTPSEINDCLHMSMPNTSRELSKLNDKGLIEKIIDADDKRKQFIKLTDEGQHVMSKTFSQLSSQLFEITKNCSEDEVQEIDRAMKLLMQKLFQ